MPSGEVDPKRWRPGDVGLEQSIFTEAETLDELRAKAIDAAICHYEPGTVPKTIRLRFVRDEVFSA